MILRNVIRRFIPYFLSYCLDVGRHTKKVIYQNYKRFMVTLSGVYDKRLAIYQMQRLLLFMSTWAITQKLARK